MSGPLPEYDRFRLPLDGLEDVGRRHTRLYGERSIVRQRVVRFRDRSHVHGYFPAGLDD